MIQLQDRSQILDNDETLQLVRVKTEYIDGKPYQQEVANFTFRCNIQPLNGRDLLIVPEGDRFKEQYWLYIPANSHGVLHNTDRVVRCGINYEVQESEAWGSYSRARIMRIDVGPEATP